MMDIDMRELEAFSCVVEKGSFSRAAEVLYLTQPTVSAHVASLERKLGSKLLVRTTREIYPSDAGELLYGYAKEILRLRTAAVQAVDSLSGEMKGTITVAASSIPAQYQLPRLIREFRTLHPHVNFSLRILENAAVADEVLARRVELGFTDAAVNLPKCVWRELTEDRLVIITPPTPRYQAYRTADFPIRQLTKEPFIAHEPGSAARLETDSFLKELGVNLKEVNTAVEVHSDESIKRMVSEGLGIAVVSQTVCEDYCRFGKLLSFAFEQVVPRRKLYAVRHKNAILAPVAQSFYDYVAAAYIPLTEQGE